MTAVPFIDGNRVKQYFGATGDGTTEDPYLLRRVVEPTPTQRTPTLTRTTTTGTIAAGAVYISIANIGNATGSVLGTTIDPGITVDFPTRWGETLGEIPYSAEGTEFLIQVIQ